ncbi:MAG: 4-hydroxy-tetrahydrodipicolinate synthase [Cyclobacteriaceae bacterium]|nr:4-hydroxy-tetrahydrodipicolinate synthase [Cyclobacteriaceae bacterium]
MKIDIGGTGVALVTPMCENGSIDYKGLLRLLQHTGGHVDYWVVMGTTGESVTLSQKEKWDVLSFVKDNNPDNIPVIYGIGGNNTQKLEEEIAHTDLSGVSAVLSVSPYYNRPSQAGLISHYTKLADISPLPLILYNVPGRTGVNITADTTLHLAQHVNILGTKEASGNLEQAMKIIADKPEDFQVISGDDLLTLPLISLGATGVISVLANAYPQLFSELVTAGRTGDLGLAQKQVYKFLKLNPLMYLESNPVGVKQVLHELGICGNHVRLPLVPASEALADEIKKSMPA